MFVYSVSNVNRHRWLHFLSIAVFLLSRMSSQHISCSPELVLTIERVTHQCEAKDSPAKAEESKVDAQQCGHHMPHKRTGFAGVQIESEPYCREQSTELTYYKVHLKEKDGHKERIKQLFSALWGQ